MNIEAEIGGDLTQLDDEWEGELERAKPYMTKFDTFQSSSDNADGSDDYSRSYSGSYSRSKDGK